MLLSLTPNPCLEKTLRVPDFAANRAFRVAPHDVHESMGGKGINMARVAGRFGTQNRALAPLGPNLRGHLLDLARRDGIELVPIEVEAPTRTCHNIVSAGGSTELLESGNALSIRDGARMLEAWRDGLRDCEMALLGGSYPPSPDASWLSHATILSSLARAANRPMLYDGRGEVFRRAIFSSTPPWAIKPNLDEARELLGSALETRAEQRAGVRELRRRGVELVFLSCGERGCWVGFENEIAWFGAPKIELVSAVGSGDSLCGAFAAKYLETRDVWEGARWAIAAGSANAARLEAASVGPDDIAPLLSQTKREIGEIRLMDFST